MKILAFIGFMLFCASWFATIVAALITGRARANWFRCGWHQTEFWFSDAGHSQASRPWHVERESTGICRECFDRMQGGLNDDCFNAPAKGREMPRKGN